MLRSVSLLLTVFLFFHLPAKAWWENGHRTTARLAAYYLTPAASAHVSAILGVPNTPESVADALAVAATWADEIKKDRPDTQSWHYIDLALQDTKDQIPERCTDNNCVTARINMFFAQLVKDKTASDPTIDGDALRFLVHFAGDVHQPLHAISDADLGGNCEPLAESYGKARNLHALWDGPLVDNLNADDKLLAAELKKDLDAKSDAQRRDMASGTPDDWAWNTHTIANAFIYQQLHIPIEPILFPASCKVAPEAITDDQISVEPNYVRNAEPIVRSQLERGGLCLAKLLNQL